MAIFGGRRNDAPRMTLDELVEGLRKTHGSDLRSIVLYGSAASREQATSYSDMNVLVLVERLPIERLRAEAEVSRAWVERGNPPPLTLTVADWRASADVFPMEYSDILGQHRVLYGEPPFADVAVRPEDLRLELEREAMGKLIHLRQGLLLAGGVPERELELLLVAFGTFMAICRGLLRLYGEEPGTDPAAIAQRAGALAGFDPAPLLQVYEHRRGTRTLGTEQVRGVAEGYLRMAERLAAHVDALWRSAEGRVSELEYGA